MIGEGVRDRGVRELWREILGCDVNVGSGLLWLLDTLTSSLPSRCVSRSWSAGAGGDWRDSISELSAPACWVSSCWSVSSCWVSCWGKSACWSSSWLSSPSSSTGLSSSGWRRALPLPLILVGVVGASFAPPALAVDVFPRSAARPLRWDWAFELCAVWPFRGVALFWGVWGFRGLDRLDGVG